LKLRLIEKARADASPSAIRIFHKTLNEKYNDIATEVGANLYPEGCDGSESATSVNNHQNYTIDNSLAFQVATQMRASIESSKEGIPRLDDGKTPTVYIVGKESYNSTPWNKVPTAVGKLAETIFPGIPGCFYDAIIAFKLGAVISRNSTDIPGDLMTGETSIVDDLADIHKVMNGMEEREGIAVWQVQDCEVDDMMAARFLQEFMPSAFATISLVSVPSAPKSLPLCILHYSYHFTAFDGHQAQREAQLRPRFHGAHDARVHGRLQPRTRRCL
jgi:hypothetical protein